MFSDDGYKDEEIHRLEQEREAQKTKIEDLVSAIERRNRTNGDLMDQVCVLNEQLKESEEENKDLSRQCGDLRVSRLDLSKELQAKEAELRRALEEIGRLKTINEVPAPYDALVASLATYIREQIENALEAHDYDY